MIVPLQKDEELIADIDSTDDVSGALHIWWLGQSGFLVKHRGSGLLFDPYLSNSLTRKYEDTDRPHVRMTERALPPRHLRGVDVVTSSHNHTDHLDAETLLALKSANPELQLVLPEANVEFARQRLGPAGPRMLPVDVGSFVQAGPFEIHGITAAHNDVAFDDQGHSQFLGFVARFGEFAVFHSGDTLWHDSLVKEVSRWKIDIAFLPINGNKPERGVAGNLNGFEAAALGRAINASIVIPCHYHMFEFNTEEPDEFVQSCQRLGQDHKVMQCGEHFVFGSPAEAGCGAPAPAEPDRENG